MLNDTAVNNRTAIPRMIRAAAAGAMGLAAVGGLAARVTLAWLPRDQHATRAPGMTAAAMLRVRPPAG